MLQEVQGDDRKANIGQSISQMYDVKLDGLAAIITDTIQVSLTTSSLMLKADTALPLGFGRTLNWGHTLVKKYRTVQRSVR